MMKTHINVLAVLMLAAAGMAQEPGSVEAIMEELGAAAITSTAPVDPDVATPADPEGLVPETPEVVLTPVEVEQVADESMQKYSAGDYEGASAGFEKVLRARPDHALARYFQSRIDSRNVRNNKEEAMEEVVQSWNGMILRSYPLTDAAIRKFKLEEVKESADVSVLFEPVSFRQGAYAKYHPNLRQIVVLNTPDDVARMESLLAALETSSDNEDGQIEIEARFVEYSQGALDELGFNWSDLPDGQAQTLNNEWGIKDGENLFKNGLRTGSDVFSTPGTTAAATGDWAASRLTDTFTDAGELTLLGDIGPNIEVLIKALDQASGTDVLSAPRVVTRAGKQAIIQVGQTHYFPETFGVKESVGTIFHPEYQDFSEKLMGVELDVKPMVKGNLIEMTLNPKITELLGWREYQIAPADSAYTFYQYRMAMSFLHDPVIGRLPIFRHREIKASVTIQDGSTIGMGGLISEKVETFSDRVPVLGSIPLIGRLFRSEGERNVKRNLMIFVTARKVSPNGRILGEQTTP